MKTGRDGEHHRTDLGEDSHPRRRVGQHHHRGPRKGSTGTSMSFGDDLTYRDRVRIDSFYSRHVRARECGVENLLECGSVEEVRHLCDFAIPSGRERSEDGDRADRPRNGDPHRVADWCAEHQTSHGVGRLTDGLVDGEGL